MPRFRADEAPFAAWLFTIAHNVVVDHRRTATRRARLPWKRDVDESRGPEESAVAAEAVAELRAMLEMLPPDQAEVVQLRLSGLRDAEIALVLGRSHGAVRVAQHRAIKRLRSLFHIDAAEVGDA